MTELRSAVFLVLAVAVTPFFGIAVPLAGVFGYRPAAFMAGLWGRIIIGIARAACGIDWQVHGTENIPNHPVVMMAKHQEDGRTQLRHAG